MVDLFEIHHGQRLTKADRIAGGIPFLTAGQENQGVACYIGNNWKKYKNPVTVDMFGNCFFHNGTYSGDDNIYFFVSDKISNKSKLFIANCIARQTLGKYSYGKQFRQPNADNLKALLPVKDGEIDFDFMESFVAELEAQRVAELSAYLKVSGYDNYELSAEELDALRRFNSLEDSNWGTYKVGTLFERVETNKLPYKAKELPKQPTEDYVLPCLTSSFQNQGLNYYAPKAGATVLSNVISIPSNSDVYRAYYQSKEFTVLSDSYAIRWKSDKIKISPNHYLFMVMCINKVTDLPIYSYKNKLGGWNVVKGKYIRLPEKDGKIDFDFMETLISATKKMAIKDVVFYSDQKIKATKKIVAKVQIP